VSVGSASVLGCASDAHGVFDLGGEEGGEARPIGGDLACLASNQGILLFVEQCRFCANNQGGVM
jgi:hypothetical protein